MGPDPKVSPGLRALPNHRRFTDAIPTFYRHPGPPLAVAGGYGIVGGTRGAPLGPQSYRPWGMGPRREIEFGT